ncbi:MAG: pyruvate, water dikinase regulatory protein [Candidatus Caldatribacteriota bacterium]|nr:pyruvate, water dikinase regulatory protein [Candidatus Caldatribacteriota bacterium]
MVNKKKELNTYIYIISDSTGETVQLVARAAISQFNSDFLKIKLFAHIESIKDIKGILKKIEKNNSLIVYTLIKPELRRFLREESEKYSISSFDIMGPIIENIEKISGISPKLEPGLIRKYDKEYFKRMEAMEFAVKYDSCQRELDLSLADLIILGVSRTSKTPLSMYLAHKGIKVANIILDFEIDPPKQIFNLPREKIVGLSIAPDKLIEIRSERLKTLGLSADSVYANQDRVLKELNYAENIYKKVGCPMINVNNKAIEDIATEILKILKGEE